MLAWLRNQNKISDQEVPSKTNMSKKFLDFARDLEISYCRKCAFRENGKEGISEYEGHS